MRIKRAIQPQSPFFLGLYTTTTMKVLSASFLALNLVGLALAQDTNLRRVKRAFNEADVSASSRLQSAIV